MTIINQDKVKQVPTKPGVYFFKNETGEIIYIGKAKHLRNRVRSYFQNSKHQSAKNISMINVLNRKLFQFLCYQGVCLTK